MIAIAELLGFVILLPACLLHLWTPPTYPSIKPLPNPLRTHVDEWRWPLLNKWYGNSEDGVSGQQAFVFDNAGHLIPYASTFPSWVPKWAIAYAWSAWRNGANNLKRPSRTDGLTIQVK
jgi:hypothetical protein